MLVTDGEGLEGLRVLVSVVPVDVQLVFVCDAYFVVKCKLLILRNFRELHGIITLYFID